MNHGIKLLISAGIGAATMYYLDPARGRYRRALVRDQIVHAGHTTTHSGGVVARDIRNRTSGVVARLRSFFKREQPEDAVITERVRACLGRAVTHPHAIHVETTDGVVTLSGAILQNEVPLLIDTTLGVRGVRDIRNELDAHTEPGHIPALQGGSQPRSNRSAFMQPNWSPTARLIGGMAGAMTAACGFSRRGAGGTLLGMAGLLLLARAATNLEMRRLTGIGVPRRAVDIQKTIRIDAPLGVVFTLWDNFENFPTFMHHVRNVRRIETGEDKERWRWTVTGPTGTEIEFDAVVTLREENELIAWRTEEGALIQHAGLVRFYENDDSTTTVDVKMTYNPVAGAVGHAIAWLLGADPKHQMDDDLMRMKNFLETGAFPRDGATTTTHGRDENIAVAVTRSVTDTTPAFPPIGVVIPPGGFMR